MKIVLSDNKLYYRLKEKLKEHSFGVTILTFCSIKNGPLWFSLGRDQNG